MILNFAQECYYLKVNWEYYFTRVVDFKIVGFTKVLDVKIVEFT